MKPKSRVIKKLSGLYKLLSKRINQDSKSHRTQTMDIRGVFKVFSVKGAFRSDEGI